MTEQNNIQQTTVLTGSNVLLSDGNQLDLADITSRNYAQYSADFTDAELVQAAALAQFVQQYEQTIELTPTDLQAISASVVGFIPRYIELTRQGGDALEQAILSTPELGVIHSLRADSAVAPLLNAVADNPVVDTVQATTAVAGALGRAANGAGGVIEYMASAPGALLTWLDSKRDALVGGPSDAQSEAVATAYILAGREAERRGSVNPSIERRAANWLDKISAGAQAALSSVTSILPVQVQQAFAWVANVIDGRGTSWEEAGTRLEEDRSARAEAMGDINGFSANYAYYLEKNTTTRTERATRVNGLDVMASAGEVAGVEVTDIAAILRNGGKYLTQDGLVAEVQSIEQDPSLTTTAVIDPSTGEQANRDSALAGQPNLDPTQILQNEEGEIDPAKGAGAIGGVVAGAATIQYARNNPNSRVGRAVSGVVRAPGAPVRFAGREVSRITTSGREATALARAGLPNMATTAAMPILRRAGYVGVAVGAAGDTWEAGEALINGDGAGVAVNSAEVVGGAAGGVGGSLAGGAAGAWSGGWIGRGIGTVVGGIAGGVAGFFGGAGVGAIPGAMAGAAAGGTLGHMAGAAIGGVGGSVYVGGKGYSAGRSVVGGTVQSMVGEPEAERRARQRAEAQARAGGAVAGITGGEETTGPNGAPILGGAPLQTVRLATI